MDTVIFLDEFFGLDLASLITSSDTKLTVKWLDTEWKMLINHNDSTTEWEVVLFSQSGQLLLKSVFKGKDKAEDQMDPEVLEDIIKIIKNGL